MPSTSIRTAGLDDGTAMARIYAYAIASGVSTMESGPVSASDMRDRLRRLSAREAALVVENAGECGGFGWLKAYSDRHGYRFACETSIYVDPSLHGSGSADALQVQVLDRARAFEYRHVVAKILTANARSLRFHARHGFELVGVQRSIGFLDGTWHDVSILQRLL
jgi:L-amino acid N-acyltransferase YncA